MQWNFSNKTIRNSEMKITVKSRKIIKKIKIKKEFLPSKVKQVYRKKNITKIINENYCWLLEKSIESYKNQIYIHACIHTYKLKCVYNNFENKKPTNSATNQP